MLKLVRRSFDDEFLIELENEILSSDIDKKIKLITMLGCMGKIKVATSDVVGLNKDKEDIDINKYVELFNSVKRR